MSTHAGPSPASVTGPEPDRSKRAGDIRARWAWVEPGVWTDRMLTALENGVKGGRWFSLIDKACQTRHLRTAFGRVQSPLAHCLLHRPWAVFPGSRPCVCPSILFEVTANWRAVCGRPARTVRREGRRKPMRRPYPYQRFLWRLGPISPSRPIGPMIRRAVGRCSARGAIVPEGDGGM